MRQLRLKLKYAEIDALDKWIEGLLLPDEDTTCIAEMAALAVLSEWQKRKLKPKLYFLFEKHSVFTIQAPLILALQHFIHKSELPVTSYIGFCLHNVKTIIYSVHNNIKLVG